MALLLLLVAATCFLAYSNGANDNFKGVATLFGSNTTDYRRALAWATATTFAGSVASVFLAQTLVNRFSGKGLVPDVVAASPDFLLAVAAGAGLTVLLAFELHVGADIFELLRVHAVAFVVFRGLRIRLGVTKESTVVLGSLDAGAPTPVEAPALAFSAISREETVASPPRSGVAVYRGRVLGINAQKMLDAAHYASAGMVSFARGLNDTPKIVALLLAVQGLALSHGMLAVAVAMALGGLLNARKVAETMSRKITPMNPGQGFTANLITGLLVVVASRFGLPVSTTHVSVGSIFGIGTVTRAANKKVVGEIVLSWVLTLPLAALLAAAVYGILSFV